MEAVRALNTPINVTELRHFLGMTGYYRQLIANYAQLALPHDELTHDGQQGQWGSAEQNAFQQLRLVLCEAPVMAHPWVNDPYILYTDACDYVISGILCQQDEEGIGRPIQYVYDMLTIRILQAVFCAKIRYLKDGRI